MAEKALLGALEGRARGRFGLLVQRAAPVRAGNIGRCHGRVEVVVNHLKTFHIGIIDADLLRRQRVLDQLIHDAIEGQRASGIEPKPRRSRAITSMAAMPPASMASINSDRVPKGNSSSPQRANRCAYAMGSAEV